MATVAADNDMGNYTCTPRIFLAKPFVKVLSCEIMYIALTSRYEVDSLICTSRTICIVKSALI